MTKQRALVWSVALCGPLVFGCQENPGGGLAPPLPFDNLKGGGPVAGTSGVGAGGDGVGTDDRPAVRAATPPPPISGGNLLVTRDGKRVVVADSDRDRLVVVDAVAKTMLASLALQPGDEPGRLVEDSAGRVHVALRRGGSLVTLDPARPAIIRRRAVCEGPRGLAADAAHDTVIVACADGQLVTLPSVGDRASVSTFVGSDLRDVIVNDSGLWVSTFKSAKLLRINEGGVVGASLGLPQLTGNVLSGPEVSTAQFQPEVAWRTAAVGGRFMMLHQAAQLDQIELAGPPGAESPDDQSSPKPLAGSGSPYGGGDACGGVVRAAFSSIDASGIVHTSAALGAGTLPVDFDVSSDGRVAVAFAGTGGTSGGTGKFSTATQTFALFLPSTLSSGPDSGLGLSTGEGGAGGDSQVDDSASTTAFTDCVTSDQDTSAVQQPVVALRFNPANSAELFLLGRNPAVLYSVGGPTPGRVFLDGADISDTGHELFHTDAGRGIACASCHPEGGEDGHVWTFSGQGARRTQALTAALAQTAPFHWDGTLANVGAVMNEVFVKRMGGLHESAERVADLEHWLFSLPSPPALLPASDAAAARGASLFNSAEVACATCHTGAAFTNNLSVLVGTSSDAMQVPSLLGIGHRAPFMHTGCAATLRDRFIPSCGGGEQHGHTAALSEAQLGDLTAYLESL